MYLPKLRQKQVNVLNLLNLSHHQFNTIHEALRVMIMKDVHIHTLVPASKECVAVLISLDAASYGSKYERSRVNSLKIAPWHL